MLLSSAAFRLSFILCFLLPSSTSFPYPVSSLYHASLTSLVFSSLLPLPFPCYSLYDFIDFLALTLFSFLHLPLFRIPSRLLIMHLALHLPSYLISPVTFSLLLPLRLYRFLSSYTIFLPFFTSFPHPFSSLNHVSLTSAASISAITFSVTPFTIYRFLSSNNLFFPSSLYLFPMSLQAFIMSLLLRLPPPPFSSCYPFLLVLFETHAFFTLTQCLVYVLCVTFQLTLSLSSL